MSTDRNNKMAADADWKDGINAFRSKIRQEMSKLEEEIDKIKQIIKGEPQ